ncbi:MAG: GNAT family N-acetyltransferase [Burkholderiaceae bacterium]|nr:GNAT family N-acetyltransferase [Burkholderiaceae bacterium]
MESRPISVSGLILRPYSDSDAEEFTTGVLESIESVGQWMDWCSKDYTVDHALKWFADCRSKEAAGTAYEYGIFCQATGKFLGGAGLNEIRLQHRFCNLGYWVRQTAQRQGIALRCVQALSQHAFRELGLYRVEIVVGVGNVASEGVAMKSGAVREGLARNRLCLQGKPVSADIFSLVPHA